MSRTDRAAVPADQDPHLWVGTSWKMTKTLAEARAFVDDLVAYQVPAGIQAFLLPALTALAAVRDRLPADSGVLLGAQNAHWEPDGAVTGEISMGMASDAGATLVEIGHSERRARFGEDDETSALKVAAAVAARLVPLICVGEPLQVREQGDAEAFVAGQLRRALAAVDAASVSTAVVAYEPVWSIGTAGRPATAAQVAPMMATIRRVGAEITGGGTFQAVLYGGGVSAANVADLLGDPRTEGVFVGRAGWLASGFIELLELCGPIARDRRAA